MHCKRNRSFYEKYPSQTLSVMGVCNAQLYLCRCVCLLRRLGVEDGSSMILHFSPGAWLGIAILMEIPLAMILLSWILKPRANRWANIVAGVIETLAVLLTQSSGQSSISRQRLLTICSLEQWKCLALC